jgi:carbonyl reductase 1
MSNTAGIRTYCRHLQGLVERERLINIACSAGRLAILKSDRLLEQFTSKDLTMDELEKLANGFVQAVEAGTHAKDGWPNTCYGLIKVAIIAMTKVLARSHNGPDDEVDERILCNSVDPQYCATDQNSQRAFPPLDRGIGFVCFNIVSDWFSATFSFLFVFSLVAGDHCTPVAPSAW